MRVIYVKEGENSIGKPIKVGTQVVVSGQKGKQLIKDGTCKEVKSVAARTGYKKPSQGKKEE